MMLFTFFGFDWKNSFWVNNGSKNQNYQFKLKFGTYTNSDMQNSMVMFTFSAFDWKYPFWVNFFQKVKIISLSEIRYLHYFQYTESNSVFHLFHFRSEMPFLG